MARSLAQTLTRLTPISPSSLSSPTRYLNSRQRSTTPERVPGNGKTEHEEAEALKNLEDAIHRIVVKRSEPGWIQLAPGASYWVPPKSKASGFAEVIEKLASNSSNAKMVKKELALSRSTSNRGWPSSASYFKGTSHSPSEGETTPKKTFKSEEEEG